MTRVLEAKFSKNELLARKLVETGDKKLVEATMDKYWAAFATPNSKSIANGTWKGANRLGILLMELRNDLRREYPDAIPPQQSAVPQTTAPAQAAHQTPTPMRTQPSANNAQPIAPSRPRHIKNKGKRGTDQRSPIELPASQYQKVSDNNSNTSYGIPTNKSPIKQDITPPLGDLFEIPRDNDTNINMDLPLPGASKVPIDDLFECSSIPQPPCADNSLVHSTQGFQDQSNHTVYIGTQSI